MLILKSRRLFTARTINSLAVFSERRRKQSAGFNDSVHRHRTQHIRDRHAHNAGSPAVPMQRRMRMPDSHRGDPIGDDGIQEAGFVSFCIACWSCDSRLTATPHHWRTCFGSKGSGVRISPLRPTLSPLRHTPYIQDNIQETNGSGRVGDYAVPDAVPAHAPPNLPATMAAMPTLSPEGAKLCRPRVADRTERNFARSDCPHRSSRHARRRGADYPSSAGPVGILSLVCAA